MTYRQAKEIVLEKHPKALLAALRTVRKRVQEWSDNTGLKKLETRSVTHEYYILGTNGIDLCSGFRSRSIAPAWIQAGLAIRGY